MTELPSTTNYLPDEVTYGFVADRIILSVGDTRYDSDRFPDGVPANGVVRFIPARTQFYTKEEPATILPQEIRCTIYNRNHPVAIENGYDSNLAGKLVDPAGHVGNVALVVGRYHVTYQLDTGQPHRVTIDVKTTHTNKKPLWIPAEAELKPLPQERFIVNERVYRETAEARDEGVEARNEAVEARNEAVEARNESVPAAETASYWARLAEEMHEASKALGITVDTSVGTRVYVGDVMIHGDTGARDLSQSLMMGNGWSADFNTRISLSRSNLVVELEIVNLSHPEGSGWTTLLRLPTGFRPRSGYFWGQTFRGQQARVASSGDVQVNAPTSQVDYVSLVFLTDPGTFPTSLPDTQSKE